MVKDKNIRKNLKNMSIEEPKGTLAKAFITLVFITCLINYGLICLANVVNISIDVYGNVITLLTFIIVVPLYLNLVRMFLDNGYDKLISFSDLFKFKKYTFKFWLFFIIISLSYFILVTILNYIPFIGFIAYIVLSVILIPVFWIMPYIFLDNPKIPLENLVTKSFKMLKHHRIDFYGLLLSFTGWFILGMLTLGILYIWLVPYVYITGTNLYLYLKEDKKIIKKEALTNKMVIILFVLGFILLNIISFVNVPDSFENFKDKLGLHFSEEKLIYNNKTIYFSVPEDYTLVTKTKFTKTYSSDEDILQYTIYLTTVDKAIKMDEDFAKKDKATTEKHFSIKKDGKTLKGYTYTLDDVNRSIVYYPKDDYVITISLTSPEKIKISKLKKLILIN